MDIVRVNEKFPYSECKPGGVLSSSVIGKSFNYDALRPFEGLSAASGIDIAKLADLLGFEVKTLAGFSLYSGSKPGLEPYCFLDDESKELYVFSIGEYQPGRMLCVLDALIRI
ncbi:hypothetical protein AAIA72_13030 [Hahella sp. SMD15-11]|uniref:Uncharacterized protein n=1 Tax=Thermohahella caldifontis TaxID=3142973 RepID=A0AB39UTV8_9GAMM